MANTVRLFLCLSLIAYIWCVCADSSHCQELFTDFPSASLGDWEFVDGDFDLTGVPTWTEHPSSFRWVYFGARGVEGLRPTFRIGEPSNPFLGDLLNHRFVWSYDQQDWSFFENNDGGNTSFQFSNGTPFTADEVYVAYSTPYPVSRTVDHVEAIQSNWFVLPTLSAAEDLTVGEVDGLPLHGFRITNPLVETPKQQIVLVGGNHSGEVGASFALEAAIDFLVSDDERAKQMRNVAEFFVYPQVDPLGREEGFYRSNSQDADVDHNRVWHLPTLGQSSGFEEVDILVQAMRRDTDGDVDFFLDFHGFWDSGNPFMFTDSRGADTAFVETLQTLEPTLTLDVDDSTTPPGILEFWAKTSDGLNADFAFTPEFSPNASSATNFTIGTNYALALYAQLGSPEFRPLANEIDVLSRELRAASTDLIYDLNRDGALTPLDKNFLLFDILNTTMGDADLDGDTDFQDFLTLATHFAQPGGWRTGDFDGDGSVQFRDFLLLAQNFGASRPAVSVPEPGACGLVLVALALIGRRRRGS